ncbi:protein-tyrosine phosphatase family protein [Lichenibacterium dinghuense]|uniref:protein-tyrosine phosphatase family protein n=1 Tax=Lichenibacterium dinghuense TaxID=2895977 RepID=UPI001F027A9F|nr:dual specificity protein phosphatase family protein [Lichenibacterium sp. 6Y81]
MNLTWITPHLAIGGRLSDAEAARLAADEGVGAVVDLRSEAVDERAILHAQGIAFLHLPTDDHAAVTAAMLDEGVAFAEAQRAAGRRLLIHCEHGIGRSATLALAALVAGGMAPLDALNLAKDRRDRVSPSPAQYGCWRDWLLARRARTSEAWEVPDFDLFASIAYRHLAAAKA